MNQQLTGQEQHDDQLLTRLQQIIGQYKRVAITGAPGSGKTTLTSKLVGVTVIHGDEIGKNLEWSKASEAVALFTNNIQGQIVVEGTQVPRAIRKGMKVDCLIILPAHEIEKRHIGMAKGLVTVLKDCLDQGLLEGVKVIHF